MYRLLIFLNWKIQSISFHWHCNSGGVAVNLSSSKMFFIFTYKVISNLAHWYALTVLLYDAFIANLYFLPLQFYFFLLNIWRLFPVMLISVAFLYFEKLLHFLHFLPKWFFVLTVKRPHMFTIHIRIQMFFLFWCLLYVTSTKYSYV